jgi:hypothetical protein
MVVPLLRHSVRSSLEAPVPRRRSARTSAFASALALVLATLTVAPLAMAQGEDPGQGQSTPPKHKKKKKKATPAPSPADSTPETSSPDTTSATSSPPPAPEPAPTPPPPPTPPPAVEPPPSIPPPERDEMTDTTENGGKRYMFVGLRYRGTIIPKFIENIFVDEGKTIYSNTIGAEFDFRKGGQSTIPWIQYTDYNTGDMLFRQKGVPDVANNYSLVNSSLKSIYIGIDELWSVPLGQSHHWDFEYGFGVGLGFLFGSLEDNWVSETANGPLVGSNGNHYAACQTAQAGVVGCDPNSHTDPNPHKVGGYKEPNWFNGGSTPVIFPHIAFPQFSFRYKPIKQLETRLSFGFELTGFWFGLSADYGLEHKDDAAPPSHGTSRETRVHDPFRDTL